MSFDLSTPELSKINSQREGIVFESAKPWVILKLNNQSHWTTYGPYATSELKLLLKVGKITPTDYCWISGWSDWKYIYLEPELYLSRRPPIELEPNKFLATNLNADQPTDEDLFASHGSPKYGFKNVFKEWAAKTTPRQYKGWRYKKPLQDTGAFSFLNSNSYSKNNFKEDALIMLEPWESKTKDLDFFEDQDSKSQVTTDSSLSSTFPMDETEIIPPPAKARKLSRFFRWTLWLSILGILAWLSFRMYSYIQDQEAINYSMSYFVVEDLTNELPAYLYARTDLKKNAEIKIRVFDLTRKQVRTKNQKAGLLLKSKGTGRIRIPMYAYDLAPGVYILRIEIEDQNIEKEFKIGENKNS